MAMAVSGVKTDATGHFAIITGKLVFSGVYPGGGGETWNLTALEGYRCGKTKNPIACVITGPNGYTYGHVPVAGDASTGKVMICTTAATELAAAGYPAGVTEVSFILIAEKS